MRASDRGVLIECACDTPTHLLGKAEFMSQMVGKLINKIDMVGQISK